MNVIIIWKNQKFNFTDPIRSTASPASTQIQYSRSVNQLSKLTYFDWVYCLDSIYRSWLIRHLTFQTKKIKNSAKVWLHLKNRFLPPPDESWTMSTNNCWNHKLNCSKHWLMFEQPKVICQIVKRNYIT